MHDNNPLCIINNIPLSNPFQQAIPKVSWAEYYDSRERLQETANINAGLLSLKRCLTCILELDVKEREKLAVEDVKDGIAASGAQKGDKATDEADLKKNQEGKDESDSANTNSNSSASTSNANTNSADGQEADGEGGNGVGSESSRQVPQSNGASDTSSTAHSSTSIAATQTQSQGGDSSSQPGSLQNLPLTGPIGPFDEDRVPFFDSKLTMIMKDSLLSRSLACIVCVGAEDCNAVETVSSLRFGEACRRLGENHMFMMKNMSSNDSNPGNMKKKKDSSILLAIQQIDKRVLELQKIIKSKEQWVWRKKVRQDKITEIKSTTALNENEEMELGGKGAVEFLKDDGNEEQHEIEHEVLGQVLVGGEEENKELEKILEQRRLLAGE